MGKKGLFLGRKYIIFIKKIERRELKPRKRSNPINSNEEELNNI
jgi:hypothetical protein